MSVAGPPPVEPGQPGLTRRRRRKVALALAVVAALAASTFVVASAALADESDTAPAEARRVRLSRVYVSNRIASRPAAYTFTLGHPRDTVTTGDWDGDGRSGFAARSGNLFTLVDERGRPQGTAAYGKSGDDVYIGDWDGDGVDTFGVRRGNVFFLRNRPTTGRADTVLGYGRHTDEVFVGDWDGDGIDSFAVRRGNLFYLRNAISTGRAERVFGYGRPGDEVLVGDWDRDGRDSFAVRRDNTIYLRNNFRSGPAQRTITYGLPTDELLVGDFDADGVDTFAARRIETVPARQEAFATTGPLTLQLPATMVMLVAFHESGNDGAQQMDPVDSSVPSVTMDTRSRGTGSRSAADIVVEPGTEIVAPVSGTVLRSGTYQLYCQYSDDFLWIEPDDRPGWQVKLLHIDGVTVGPGDRVEAGETEVAPRATVLPFESQVDELTPHPHWPHVHVEVVDPSIPDQDPPQCASGQPLVTEP